MDSASRTEEAVDTEGDESEINSEGFEGESISRTTNSLERKHDGHCILDKQREAIATEKVLNAMIYYRRYGRDKIRQKRAIFNRLPDCHQRILSPVFLNHLTKMKECVDVNQRVLKMICAFGVAMFGDDCAMRTAAEITQLRPASEHYMSKVRTTLKQIMRDWSEDGMAERKSCYDVVSSALNKRFPDKSMRAHINVLVPGAGLGRFAWGLVLDGFSVQGNEFSLFMLLTSNFILNQCQKRNEFTVYPFVLDTCNNWTYEDQLRPIHFPDICPSESDPERENTFSMSAGDFLDSARNEINKWSAVVTVFFIDTAANLLEYIDTIHRILKPGGVWLNFGPLAYHFADDEDADSIELPYSEVVRLIVDKGFRFERDDRIENAHIASYVRNRRSMLQYEYTCGFFECIKL